MENSAHFNKGNRTDIAFVFSVPGQEEEKNGKPVSGITGDNLDRLLKLLEIEYSNKYEFRITNSYDKPLYKAKDGKTEASVEIIQEPKNIERLFKELTDIEKYIIFFGDKSMSASIYLTSLKAKFVFCKHLGLQSINQIDRDLEGNKLLPKQSINTEKRLELLAEYIKQQMCD
ncbi:MAG: hypothetical protein K9J13_14565 [Saprospiraceae bacterium]|nr:hypothetical protein [Saprospiraceae bacterium]